MKLSNVEYDRKVELKNWNILHIVDLSFLIDTQISAFQKIRAWHQTADVKYDTENWVEGKDVVGKDSQNIELDLSQKRILDI